MSVSQTKFETTDNREKDLAEDVEGNEREKKRATSSGFINYLQEVQPRGGAPALGARQKQSGCWTDQGIGDSKYWSNGARNTFKRGSQEEKEGGVEERRKLGINSTTGDGGGRRGRNLPGSVGEVSSIPQRYVASHARPRLRHHHEQVVPLTEQFYELSHDEMEMKVHRIKREVLEESKLHIYEGY